MWMIADITTMTNTVVGANLFSICNPINVQIIVRSITVIWCPSEERKYINAHSPIYMYIAYSMRSMLASGQLVNINICANIDHFILWLHSPTMPWFLFLVTCITSSTDARLETVVTSSYRHNLMLLVFIWSIWCWIKAQVYQRDYKCSDFFIQSIRMPVSDV